MDIRLFRNDDQPMRPIGIGQMTALKPWVGTVRHSRKPLSTFHVHTAVDVFYFNDPNVTGVQVSRGMTITCTCV